jgi:hypothetical protein
MACSEIGISKKIHFMRNGTRMTAFFVDEADDKL